MKVKKRDGSFEPLNIEQIHRVVEFACEDVADVHPSLIENNSQLKFYDGIPTYIIHETLIRSAAELITEHTPNYQIVAGRLLSYHLRKLAYGKFEPPVLEEIWRRGVDQGIYDPDHLANIDWKQANQIVKHERDDQIYYAGMLQWQQKYLLRDKQSGKFFETPQAALALIALTLFKDNLKEAKLFYDLISTHVINLPTPILAGVRSTRKQFSSCVLIDSGDSLDSISSTVDAIIRYVSKRAGIGINGGRIRAVRSPVGDGTVSHTGVIPFYRLFQSAVHSCSQGGVRNGAATLYVPIWHYEIEDIMVLKNNKGTADVRLRDLDYGIQISRLFYRRLIDGDNISLFSPSEVPGLYDAFLADQQEFERLYVKYEKDKSIRKKTIKALDLFKMLMIERKETGRIYIMHIDHVNERGPFLANKAPIATSNLCVGYDTHLEVSIGGEPYVAMPAWKVYQQILYSDTPIWVKAFDEENQRVVESRLMGGFMTPVRDDRCIMMISTNIGKTLIVTEDHKVYTVNRGYVHACDLRVGDNLICLRQDFEYYHGHVTNLKKRDHAEYCREVYDFTVEGTHNFFAEKILVHNCAEITLPTQPINKDEGEIALCTLAAINLGKINKPSDLRTPCHMAVKALNALLRYQDYMHPAALRSTKKYRPLGIGWTGFAHWLAKNGLKYSEPDLEAVGELAEHFAYYLTEASIDEAETFGPMDALEDTIWGQGKFPWERHPEVRARLDWEPLRERLKQYGIYNATLSAQMPCETSSQASNSTNGIEPPRALVSYKQSKDGVTRLPVPDIKTLKKKYELLWHQKSPRGYLQIVGEMQKWFDQSISANTSYNPLFYPDNEIPLSELIRDLIYTYQLGIKTLYYFNTNDQVGEINSDCESCTV